MPPGHYKKPSRHLLDQLNTFTLGGDEAASATNVSDLTDPIHIQETNLGALETANTINSALFRLDGGIIPDTAKVEYIDLDADDTGWKTVFQPAAAEVWMVHSLSIGDSGGGNMSVSASLYDPTADKSVLLDAATGTVTTGTVLSADWNGAPVFLSNTLYLRVYVATNSNGMSIYAGVSRVR